MKRKRKSAACDTQIQIGNMDDQIEEKGPLLTDLPKPVFWNILLKLPTRSILICKCVCKTWRARISDPEFAKLHFAQAEPCPLLSLLGPTPTRVPRTLYLVEPEDPSGFDLKDCACAATGNACDQSHVHMKLTKYKIPLRNDEEVINNNSDNGNVMPNGNRGTKRKTCIRIPPHHHKYNVVNSCNGLLLLSEPIHNDPAVVCNPVTGEFIDLPESSRPHQNIRIPVECGLGFSSETNEYKVIRIFEAEAGYCFKFAEIHTLGTGSWKSIGEVSETAGNLVSPTYAKGVLYWYESYGYRIRSFDLNTEKFKSVPSPPFPIKQFMYVGMGVLEGCLCLCDSYGDLITVWTLTDSGGKHRWTKVIAIDKDDSGRWPYGVYTAMKYYKSYGLFMFHSQTNSFFYYHPEKPSSYVYLKLCGFKANFQAISHVPSFILLKDILAGKDVEVLNINTRCAGLKLQGETRALSLKEEIAEFESDPFSSDNYCFSDE
ncbi:hypothetical protein TB1_024979 [Malus domestica]